MKTKEHLKKAKHDNFILTKKKKKKNNSWGNTRKKGRKLCVIT